MGGVPRSQGCQTCKQRKIKCDETWPICAQCSHLGATCPGPTALVKFVNSKNPLSKAAPLVSRPAPPSKPWKFAADSKDVRSKKVHYAKVDDSAAGSYGLLFFGKPKAMPTTLAERIANRLTTKMQDSQHGVTSLHMSYLIFTPRRLAESACLRDAVDCFCSAWSDFQSREPRGELIALPQYGKALRSVRRALLSPREALKTETLAAITIMERACTLFDRQNSVSIHLKGIVQLILNKGPPDLNDDLDVAVSNESHSALMPTWVYGESVAFLTKSPWKEVLDECAISHSRLQGLDWKFLSLDDALILYRYAKGIPERRKQFQELFLGPASDETKDSSIALMNQLLPVYNHVAELATQARVKGLEVGELTESPNPGGLTKMRYSFISALLALTFQAMIVGQMNMLHMLIQLNKLGGDDPELGASFWAQYRSAAQDFWKFLPYFYELDSVVAWHFLPSLCLTWEAAEEEREQEAIMNMVLYMDSYLQRWSKEPNIVKISMLETAKLLTGRRPDLAIL